MPSRNLLLPTLALLAVGLLAGVLTACGGDDDDDASNADVLSAINILDKAGLHDIDDSINAKQAIPANARTTALHLQAVTLLTEWPKDLEEPAKKLAATFANLAAALDGDKPDMTKAGAAAKAAHDAQHDFSHEVWEHLQDEAGIKADTAAHTEN